MDTTGTIEIEQIGSQFVASIPLLGTKVTGATHDEALTNAQRAIVAAMIDEAEKRKRRNRRKGHTVA